VLARLLPAKIAAVTLPVLGMKLHVHLYADTQYISMQLQTLKRNAKGTAQTRGSQVLR
jgi:hypothetical protein